MDGHTELSLPNIRYPKRPNQYLSNDYHHRVSTISMHLSFEKWMQQLEVNNYQFMTYYKQYKATKIKRFEAETRLQFKDGKHYTLDAFCTYTSPNGKEHIFVLEVYNSKGNHRIKYVVEQLEKLLRIIDHTKKVEQRTSFNAIPRILCSFDSKSFLVGVFKRIRSNPFFQIEHIEKLLYFNVDVNVWNHFEKEWVNMEGKVFDLDSLQPI